ncbi:MAG TPA: multicopper oxidase domain-containing protein [Bradyrhizobium sp.]
MIGIETMADRNLRLDRRGLLAGLGAAALGPVWGLTPLAGALAQPPRLALTARAGTSGPGKPDGLYWTSGGAAPDHAGGLRRGDSLAFAFGNELPVAALLNWHGLDGIQAAEPLTVQAALSAGARQDLQIALRQAGTFLGDLRLLGDSEGRAARTLAVIVGESEAVSVDRDEIVLLEDWRLRPDGTALAPGGDARDASRLYTINGEPSRDILLRSNARLRLRVINGFQRTVIAVKIESFEIRVMALDSQPAEPFLARNGTLLLAPGARIDAFIDATAPPGSKAAILLHDGREAQPIGRLLVSDEPPLRAAPLPPAPPLPANPLPARLDLKNALRFELMLGGPATDWVAVPGFTAASAPAFRAKAGRTVVLALTNRAAIATVFHLHGHHFRLLDRLDDGWKPFWLDTLAIEPGQSERVAFAADYRGRWLLEAMAADWAAQRLVRWYSVE